MHFSMISKIFIKKIISTFVLVKKIKIKRKCQLSESLF